MRTLVLDVPAWPDHRAGHHVDGRLTAEDGYQASRSYSIASAPEHDTVELTIERFENGEVSPYLVEDVIAADQFEVRGPIGGYFVWEERPAEPLFLIGGGSGVVPVRAMLRHHSRNAGRRCQHRLQVEPSLGLGFGDRFGALQGGSESFKERVPQREKPAELQGKRGSKRVSRIT